MLKEPQRSKFLRNGKQCDRGASGAKNKAIKFKESKRVIFLKPNSTLDVDSNSKPTGSLSAKLLNRGELVSLDREEHGQREKPPEV